jgi:predicted ribonuclease YlaK
MTKISRDEVFIPAIKPAKKMRLADLVEIEMLTPNQIKAREYWQQADNDLLMAGSAGTGKTFLAMHFALEQVLLSETPYKNLIIVRSAVPTRDMGFLPGDQAEKEDPFTAAYKQTVEQLFGGVDDSAWTTTTSSNQVQFMTTSYVRGITIRDAVVVVDEIQNMTYHEIRSVITRLGPRTRLILCGDTAQSDLHGRERDEAKRGFDKLVTILKAMRNTEIVTFRPEDSVRSGRAREYLITEELLFKE